MRARIKQHPLCLPKLAPYYFLVLDHIPLLDHKMKNGYCLDSITQVPIISEPNTVQTATTNMPHMHAHPKK